MVFLWYLTYTIPKRNSNYEKLETFSHLVYDTMTVGKCSQAYKLTYL